MIEVRDLHKRHGSLAVLRGVSLTLARGEVAAIVGPSGGGKSTLLRCINGLESFEQGEVQIGSLVRSGRCSRAKAPSPASRRAGQGGHCLSTVSICFLTST